MTIYFLKAEIFSQWDFLYLALPKITIIRQRELLLNNLIYLPAIAAMIECAYILFYHGDF